MYFSTNAFVALCLDCTHRHNSELQKALVSKRSKLLNWGVEKYASRPSFLLGFPCGESVGALIRDHFLATTISISELIWHLGDPYKRKPKCRRHCNYLIIERRIYLGEFGRGDGETELISSNLLAGPLLYCLSLILLQVGATKVVFAYHTDDPTSETDIKHQMTIPLLWSSVIFLKLLYYNVMTKMLVFVDDNSFLVSTNSETW